MTVYFVRRLQLFKYKYQNVAMLRKLFCWIVAFVCFFDQVMSPWHQAKLSLIVLGSVFKHDLWSSVEKYIQEYSWMHHYHVFLTTIISDFTFLYIVPIIYLVRPPKCLLLSINNRALKDITLLAIYWQNHKFGLFLLGKSSSFPVNCLGRTAHPHPIFQNVA